jgi:hypothetical protein
MMGAGLQADVEIRSASRVACRSQSYDFCVITPGTRMKTFANDDTIFDHKCTHARVGMGVMSWR